MKRKRQYFSMRRRRMYSHGGISIYCARPRVPSKQPPPQMVPPVPPIDPPPKRRRRRNIFQLMDIKGKGNLILAEENVIIEVLSPTGKIRQCVQYGGKKSSFKKKWKYGKRKSG